MTNHYDTDAARAEMRRVLENEFRSFLAHDPHDPDRFWGLAVDAVMRAVARAEPDPEPDVPAWPTAPHVWWEGEVWARDDDGDYQIAGDCWMKSHMNDGPSNMFRNDARRFAREAIPVTIVPAADWVILRRCVEDEGVVWDAAEALIDATEALNGEIND